MKPEENYKPDDLFLEQYKLYVEMLDRNTKRRMETNALFISIHTAMVTFVSLFNRGNPWALLVVAAAGIAFSFLWRTLLINYSVINSAKWEVVYDMEQRLPYKPFYGEWYEKLGYSDEAGRTGNPSVTPETNPKPYSIISGLEKALPWFFGFLYITIGIAGLYILAKGGPNPSLTAAIAEVNKSIAELNDVLAKLGASGIG